MISKTEVLEFSREFGLSAHVIEKDYVLGWLLAGIAAHPALGKSWIFKGGTCLKKCYFETYRFSEDLDFTLPNSEHLTEEFLMESFAQISAWIYSNAGIELPEASTGVEIYTNPRGNDAAQGKMGYRGPLLRQSGDLPRIKLDLTDDEVVVSAPVLRKAHHPYSDSPDEGIRVLCYSFEELLAEKIRALAERKRPRDLYDVIHLYRRDDANPNRQLVMQALKAKCDFKGIAVPKMETIASQAEKQEIEEDWAHMLKHQLPMLPPFHQFWNELREVFDWLYETRGRVLADAIPSFGSEEFDHSWRPSPMVQAWNMQAPLEIIRFAAANRLCVNLKYKDAWRLIEPYSLRKTKAGNILLYAIRQADGELRAYRVDRVQDAVATDVSFMPQYAIELTPSGPLNMPETARK